MSLRLLKCGVSVLLMAWSAGCSEQSGPGGEHLRDAELARQIVGSWRRAPGARVTNVTFDGNGLVVWHGSNIAIFGTWRVSNGKLYYASTNCTDPGLVDGTEFEHRLLSLTESELIFSVDTNIVRHTRDEATRLR